MHNNKKDIEYVKKNFTDEMRNKIIDCLKDGCDGLVIFEVAEDFNVEVSDISAIFRAGRPDKLSSVKFGCDCEIATNPTYRHTNVVSNNVWLECNHRKVVSGHRDINF